MFVRGRQKEKGSYSASRGKSSSGYKGRSKSRVKGDKIYNYCKKDNHYIIECYKLKNKEKRNSISNSRGKTEDEGKASVATESGGEGDVLVAFVGCA